MKIHTTKEILIDLQIHMQTKSSFALMRLGDGGLKYIHATLFNDTDQLIQISEKEGIPICKVDYILDLWKTSANICNYIDSTQVYFSDYFWPRVRKGKQSMSKDTVSKMKGWLKLYRLAGFRNENFCNPEINFLSCIDICDITLLDLIHDVNVCCITSYDESLVRSTLGTTNIDVITIANQTGNQFSTSFNSVISNISKNSKNYDIWLIAAGELGRIYTGLIKYYGGIAFDIGSLIDFWCKKIIPVRLKWFIQPSKQSPLKLGLTDDGMQFIEYIRS